ncbi:MAG: ABC transporter permease [Tenericutes bacterium GWC2_34_14]|nr:MAG: ABC transporter permease [Tenericutes bacterium GWC2_34_14]OHE33236.1 MAG: ABC transporter permease [Tenericutes bacterium GWE2_34_108]OHE36386.1 MAG: ABC transporter permease [Tenericutes bacterium GWF1_35_14]OHE37590.1 MAG: ABC transporter permease [Tenericutes bacterium GWF2_35_184]OHE45133.1 MAG: ABC transporter permease [Tenericutes bacterium RIFOXYA2_FULL_36_32]OHE45898.1 MAG: ABC transporter permease [Tenericutes bacterium RIFOXYA12_FULL_35_10]OHE48973.1 MAG: ABC transporter pe
MTLTFQKKIKSALNFKKRRKLNRSKFGDISLFLLLLIFGTFSAYPLIMTVSNAFKSLDELFLFPPRLFPRNITFDNFRDLSELIGNSWIPFSRYFFNTILITLSGTIGHVLIASMCAYPLAKYKFPGRNLIFTLVVYSLMFAPQVTATPNYIIISRIGLIDTPLAIILPAIASSLGLYLMKQFMQQIPDELIESAKIDGASEYRIFFQIVMPLVKPAWLTLVILLFQRLWTTDGGSFIFSEELKPVSYALRQIAQGSIERAGTIAAVSFIMMIVPVTFFILSQSRIVETFSHSGMK